MRMSEKKYLLLASLLAAFILFWFSGASEHASATQNNLTPNDTPTATPTLATVIQSVNPAPPYCVLWNTPDLYERTLELNGFGFPTTNAWLNFRGGGIDDYFRDEVNWKSSTQLTVDMGLLKDALRTAPQTTFTIEINDDDLNPISNVSPEFIVADDNAACGIARPSPTPTLSPTATLTPTPTPTPRFTTLRKTAKTLGLQVGGHGFWWEVNNTPKFKKLLTREYNMYLSDCDLCWIHTHPKKDKFDFAGMDQVVSQAQAAKMQVQAHHLLWGYRKVLPNWLLKGNFTKNQLRKIIKNHIKTLVTRYRRGSPNGEIAVWTVVNELFVNGPDGSTNFFTEKLEDDPNNPTYAWVDDAFRWAHQADPNAVLLLNDWAIEFGGDKSDRFYDLVKGMVERGVPIDGVGFQMHTGVYEPENLELFQQLLADNIQRFRALGLQVYVTEWDAHLINNTRADRFEMQAEHYRRFLQTFLDNGVTSISFMGLTDKFSWWEDISPLADATLFDDQYNKKPAYDAILAELNARASAPMHRRSK